MASSKLIARRYPKSRDTEASGRPKFHSMHSGNESTVTHSWLEHMNSLPSIRLSAKGNSELTLMFLGDEAKLKLSRRSHILEERKLNTATAAASFVLPNRKSKCTLWFDSDVRTPTSKDKNGQAPSFHKDSLLGPYFLWCDVSVLLESPITNRDDL